MSFSISFWFFFFTFMTVFLAGAWEQTFEQIFVHVNYLENIIQQLIFFCMRIRNTSAWQEIPKLSVTIWNSSLFLFLCCCHTASKYVRHAWSYKKKEKNLNCSIARNVMGVIRTCVSSVFHISKQYAGNLVGFQFFSCFLSFFF